MLSPLAELESGEPQVAALGWKSLVLWPRWLREMGAGDYSSDTKVHFAQRGSLLLAHGADRATAERSLARIHHHAPDNPPQAWTPAQLQQHEPALARGLLGWHLPGEGQIHTVQAMAALAAAGQRAGVQWCWNTSVQHVQAGRLDERRFDLAIDTRGLGARIATSTREAPARVEGGVPGLRGVRGEIFWLHAPGVRLTHPLRLLHPRHRVYLVPRPGDVVVVGATEIESDDRSPVSLRSTVELLAAAHSTLPELAEARVIHSESNCRPALADNLPLLHLEPGLLRLNGLFRHGWLLAPALVDQALARLASFACDSAETAR